MSDTHCVKHGVRWFDVSQDAGKPDHRCIICTTEHVAQLKQRNADLCAMVARLRKERSFLKKIVEGVISIVNGGSVGQVYIVREGDALSCIARDLLGDAYRWPEIVALNRLKDSTIYPGQMLLLPLPGEKS